jgi:hypothetical protein
MKGNAASRLLVSAFILLLLGVAPATATAGLFRAYLSINGNDANDCSFATPCRLLPAALAAANDGGEVWMLDSGNFNTGLVLVSKSMTILAIPGAQGSIVSTFDPGIRVTGTAIRVTLRNLSFRDLSGNADPGISFTSGASLFVEGCRFSAMSGVAISAFAPGGQLTVRDSVVRNNGSVGITISDSMTVAIDHVEIADNAVYGILIGDGAKVSISNSIISGSGDIGVYAQAVGAGGVVQVNIDRSALTGNFAPGFYANASGAGSVVRAVVSRSTLSQNGNDGVVSNGAGATVVIDGNTIAQQPTGTGVFNNGTILTRQNNVFSNNGLDNSGALPSPITPR